MKQINKKTFPRSTKLTATLHVPKAGNYTIKGDINSKKFQIVDEHGNPLYAEKICIEQNRMRKSMVRKGPKEICKILYSGSLSLSLNEALLNFDHIYAVDTNTKHVSDSWLSAGSICYLTDYQKIGVEYTYRVKLVRQITSINMSRPYQMEQHVWNAAISYIQSIISTDNTVALIVDCDLDNIPKYNERVLKIRDLEYLPENFTLIYASADTGSNIANKMISFCDFHANRILEELTSSKIQK